MLTIMPLVLALATPAPPSQQTQTKTTESNNWGGKSEITTDLKGNVIREKHMDSKGVVREEKTVDYGPNAGETEENIRSFDQSGRLDRAQQIFKKDGKPVKGTSTKWVYKDDNDKQGTRGEELVVDPETGAWIRPILAAHVQLDQGERPNDFSVGYNLMHFPGETYKLGLIADYSHSVIEAPACDVRVVGAFEFAHPKSTTFVHNIGMFLGGVRIGFHTHGPITPFAEVEAGLIRWGTTNFVVQYGGGVDIPVGHSKTWDLRAGGGWATAFNGGFSFTAVRLEVGLRHPF